MTGINDMIVTIEAMGPLRKYMPEGKSSAPVELSDDTRVSDALRALGVPEGTQWNASVRGQLVYADTELSDGDRLLAFAPISGGAGCGNPEGAQ